MNITELKQLQKVNAKGGGGKSNFKFGLWQDAKGKQRHITTTIFGIDKTEKFVLSTKDNKVVFTVFTDKQAQALDKLGIKLFSTSKDGNKKGVQHYHNYASIEGINEKVFNNIASINEGVKKHNKAKASDIFKRYTVQRVSDIEFKKMLQGAKAQSK